MLIEKTLSSFQKLALRINYLVTDVTAKYISNANIGEWLFINNINEANSANKTKIDQGNP